MAVTAQEYTQQIKQMLPHGLAWNADDTDRSNRKYRA